MNNFFVVYLAFIWSKIKSLSFFNNHYMKKIILIFTLCLFSYVVKSQDIIVNTNGKEIKTKIVETTPDQVTFRIYDANEKQICSIDQKIKKFRKQHLPVEEQVFSIPRNQVFMIKYENGKNDIYREKVEYKTAKNVLNFIDVNNNPEAYKMYRDGYKLHNLSRGLIGAGGGLCAFGAVTLFYNGIHGKYNNTEIGASFIYTGIGAVLLFTGLQLSEKSIKKMNSAFDLYRNSLKTAQNNYHLDFGITQNGLGLNLKF